MFSCEFCEISKNTFSYRTPLVAASGLQRYEKETRIQMTQRQMFFCEYCEFFKSTYFILKNICERLLLQQFTVVIKERYSKRFLKAHSEAVAIESGFSGTVTGQDMLLCLN